MAAAKNKKLRAQSVANRRLSRYSVSMRSIAEALPGLANGSVEIETFDPIEALKFEDAVFDVLCEGSDKVNVEHFWHAIELTGVRRTDPRLANTQRNFEKYIRRDNPKQFANSCDCGWLSREEFSHSLQDDIVLIEKILKNKMIIPDWEDFTENISRIYDELKDNQDGEVASYIPQLARVDPKHWGVSICTIDGQRLSIGDANVPFCLQSSCKVFNYCMAVQDFDAETVHRYIGCEPSGRIFNELVLDYRNRPHNPMVNAGAIITVSLLINVWHTYKRLAGNEFLGFNNATHMSEKETANRNFALAFYMMEHDCFPKKTNLDSTLDLYFQLCSIEETCESGAVMAATFANGGVNPITDDVVVSSDIIRDVLSLMYSCGVYDYSGKFAFDIGLPAKSGVSGVLLLVVPNVMGMCLWSPKLDRWGNSARCIQFCEHLVQSYNFHNFDPLRIPDDAVKKDPRHSQREAKGQQVVNILFSAANGDKTALRRWLLQGGDLSLADYDGRTALHLAAAEGHTSCVQFLLQIAKVDPDVSDRWDHTPADEAKMAGYKFLAALIKNFIHTGKWDEKAAKQDSDQRRASRKASRSSGDQTYKLINHFAIKEDSDDPEPEDIVEETNNNIINEEKEHNLVANHPSRRRKVTAFCPTVCL